MTSANLNFNSWLFRISRSKSTFLLYATIYAIDILIINYIEGMQIYLKNYGPFFDIINLLIISYSLITLRKIPKIITELVNSNVLDNKNFNKFKKYTEKSISTKKLYILPIILSGIYLFITIIFYDIFINYSQLNQWGVVVNVSDEKMLLIIMKSINWALNSFVIFITLQTLVYIYIYFKCINRLGTSSFPLKIHFEDLQVGFFKELGHNITQFSIPTIFLATALGILGVISIYIMKVLNVGVEFSTVSIIILILIISLFYRSTINIHKTIVTCKIKIKKKLLHQINNEMNNIRSIDFVKINNIQSVLNNLNKINEWPYNHGSLKKIGSIMMTTIIPIIISFLGIYHY